MSFQIESCRKAMARAGDHGYWIPAPTIMRSAFNMPDIKRALNALICLKSLDVISFVLSFACRSVDFSRTNLLGTMALRCSLYFTTLLVFVDCRVRDESLEIEA